MAGVDAVAGSTGTQGKTVDPSQVGFNGLNADSFMKLLIAQLQNQDPTEPVTNEQLLNQISTMRNLQSNIELSDVLKSIASNQQFSAAASFIGKSVTAATPNGDPVTGIVDRVFLRDGKPFVGFGPYEFSVDQILSITLPEVTAESVNPEPDARTSQGSDEGGGQFVYGPQALTNQPPKLSEMIQSYRG